MRKKRLVQYEVVISDFGGTEWIYWVHANDYDEAIDAATNKHKELGRLAFVDKQAADGLTEYAVMAYEPVIKDNRDVATIINQSKSPTPVSKAIHTIFQFTVRDCRFDRIKPDEYDGIVSIVNSKSGFCVFSIMGTGCHFQLDIPMIDLGTALTFSTDNGCISISIQGEVAVATTAAVRREIKRAMKATGEDRFELYMIGTSENLQSTRRDGAGMRQMRVVKI